MAGTQLDLGQKIFILDFTVPLEGDFVDDRIFDDSHFHALPRLTGGHVGE